MLDRPARLLRHRVPRHQHSLERAGDLLAEALIRRHIACAQIEPDIEPARGIGLPIGLGCVEHPRLEGRDVDEVLAGVERHRVPVVATQRARHHQRGLAGLVDAGLGVLDRATRLRIDPGGPVDADIGLGADELARLAVDHIEEAVLGRLHQHLARLPVDLHVGQHDVLRGGVIPRLARRGLVVPDIFAGRRPDRDDAGEVEVIALARPVLAGAAIGAVPRAPVADPDIEQAKIRVIGHRIPHRAAAADRVIGAQHVHVPGFGGLLEIGGCVFALPSLWHRVELPQLLAAIGIIGGDKAAHAEFGPAIADDHLAIDHARRAGDGVALGLVDRDLLPRDLAGLAVQRDQAPVERAEEQLVAPCR